jgi:hypothetical protein
VDPGVRSSVSGVGNRVEGIERTGVDLTGLCADDRRLVADAQMLGEQPPLVVCGEDVGGRAKAEHAQRSVDRAVPLLTHDGADRRRAVQTALLDVPACLGEHVMASRGEGGEARHLAAGHEPERGVLGQAEQLDEPCACDVLDDRCGRAADIQAGVLIPRRRKPVGSERRGHGTADHEPEVAATRLGDEPGLGGCGKLADDGARVGRTFGKRAAERVAQLIGVDGGKDRALGQRLVEVGGDAGGQLQKLAQFVGHLIGLVLMTSREYVDGDLTTMPTRVGSRERAHDRPSRARQGETHEPGSGAPHSRAGRAAEPGSWPQPGFGA